MKSKKALFAMIAAMMTAMLSGDAEPVKSDKPAGNRAARRKSKQEEYKRRNQTE